MKIHPPIGAIIEIKFNDYTAAGLPRFPAFLRVRTDMMADRPKRKAAKPVRKKTMAKRDDVWSPGGDLGNAYVQGKTVSFVGQESGGDGVFRYPGVTFKTPAAARNAARRAEIAFEAGEIYVPDSFEEPYSLAKEKALASWSKAIIPKKPERKATKPFRGRVRGENERRGLSRGSCGDSGSPVRFS